MCYWHSEQGKAADTKGIEAEDLDECDSETKELIRDTFNMIINQDSMAPGAWKTVMIKVIYRKGDPTKSENYRPVCTLPALYILFSTVICNRL